MLIPYLKKCFLSKFDRHKRLERTWISPPDSYHTTSPRVPFNTVPSHPRAYFQSRVSRSWAGDATGVAEVPSMGPIANMAAVSKAAAWNIVMEIVNRDLGQGLRLRVQGHVLKAKQLDWVVSFKTAKALYQAGYMRGPRFHDSRRSLEWVFVRDGSWCWVRLSGKSERRRSLSIE